MKDTRRRHLVLIHIDALVFQQLALAAERFVVRLAKKSTQIATCTNHTMTRHHQLRVTSALDAVRILAQNHSDGARGFGLADVRGDRAVRADLAFWNLACGRMHQCRKILHRVGLVGLVGMVGFIERVALVGTDPLAATRFYMYFDVECYLRAARAPLLRPHRVQACAKGRKNRLFLSESIVSLHKKQRSDR